MKKLLKYYFKNRWLFVLIISVLAILINITANIEGFIRVVIIEDGNDVERKVIATNAPIIVSASMACVLATVIPTYEFYFKMKKINVDQYYSLPIKKQKLFLGIYLIGLLEIIIPVTIGYFYSLIYTFCSENIFNMAYFIPYYFILIGLIIVLYSTICFIYCRNNTFGDGFVAILAYIFLGVAITSFINYYFIEIIYPKNYNKLIVPENFFLYSPIVIVTNIYYSLMTNHNFKIGSYDIVSIVLFSIIGIASFIAFILLSKKEKAENASQISKSWFSYRLLIPLYTFLIIVMTFYELSSLIWLIMFLIAFCTYFSYCLYQRTIKLRKKYLLTMIITIICAVMASVIRIYYLYVK